MHVNFVVCVCVWFPGYEDCVHAADGWSGCAVI